MPNIYIYIYIPVTSVSIFAFELLQDRERFEEEANGTDQEAAEGGMHMIFVLMFVLTLIIGMLVPRPAKKLCTFYSIVDVSVVNYRLFTL